MKKHKQIEYFIWYKIGKLISHEAMDKIYSIIWSLLHNRLNYHQQVGATLDLVELEIAMCHYEELLNCEKT